MNGYAEMVGDAFIELRGAGFSLSALDVDLISQWERQGVPMSLPLAVIADATGYRDRKSPQLRVRSLSFVKEEVEARFAELLEGHVGCGGCDKSYCAGGERLSNSVQQSILRRQDLAARDVYGTKGRTA